MVIPESYFRIALVRSIYYEQCVKSIKKNRLLLLPEGNSIGELVKALNAIGVTPRDLITILQSMKAAGALQAALEIL